MNVKNLAFLLCGCNQERIKPSVVEKAHALNLHVIQDCVLVQLP